MTQSISNFESASIGYCTLKVKKLGDDRQEQIVEYTLVMDFNAIAKAQNILGRDLTDVSQWSKELVEVGEVPKWDDLSGSDISTICWCSFDRFYPEVELKEVREMLPPGKSAVVCNMLLEMCFPGILARIAAYIDERAKAAPGEKAADPTSAGKS